MRIILYIYRAAIGLGITPRPVSPSQVAADKVWKRCLESIFSNEVTTSSGLPFLWIGWFGLSHRVLYQLKCCDSTPSPMQCMTTRTG